MQDQVHPFQRTLGPGPYRFVGHGQIHFSDTFGSRYVGPECEAGAGTCAHCSQPIIYIYVIETAEKRRFGVGCDCILKVGLPVRELTKIQRIELARQKELRKARKAKKGAAAREQLSYLILERGDELKQTPHPSRPNDSLYNYAAWCLKNSRDGGIVLVLKRIKTLLGEVSK